METHDPPGLTDESAKSDVDMDLKLDEVDGSPVSHMTDEVLQHVSTVTDQSQLITEKGDAPPEQLSVATIHHPDESNEENSNASKLNEGILISETRSLVESEDSERVLVIDINDTNLSVDDAEKIENDDQEKNGIQETESEEQFEMMDAEERIEEDMDTCENEQVKDESKSEPIVEVASKDIGLDYFERLENSLRELEKQMSNSGNSSESTDHLSTDNQPNTTNESLSVQNGLQNTEEPPITAPNSDENNLSSEVVDSLNSKDLGSREATETGENNVENTTSVVSHDLETQSSNIDKVDKKPNNKPERNATEMWSNIGMMRCSKCSFTTDQEAMLNSHEVICSKRKVVKVMKGEINFKYKSDRYGCEACLYTTKSARNFEEHIAFHLLAQPYICLKCVATFESKSSIEAHVSSLHNGDKKVKCGLRGSKKINHIIETLHKDSKYSLTGRLLDKKIWNMSMASSAKDQNSKGNSGNGQSTSPQKKLERPSIIQQKNFMKSSPSKKDPLVLEPVDKTEKPAPEKIQIHGSPKLSCTVTSSLQLSNVPNSTVNVSSFILVPVTMAPKPPPPAIQPAKPLVSILGNYTPPINRPQQPMIVMNQHNVVPQKTPQQQIIVLPASTSTPSSPVIHPQSILKSLIPTPTTVQQSLAAQQQVVVSSTICSQTRPLPLNSAANSSATIQNVQAGKMITSTQSEESKQSNANEKLGSVIDLTEGISKKSCRISFRKEGSSYVCKYCKVKNETEDGFSRHIWRHFHGLPPICKKCPNSYSSGDFAKCALVTEVMKKLAISEVEDKKSTNVIEVDSDDDPAEAQQLTKDTDVQMKENPNSEEDSCMQIKIASTYSLSESPKPTTEKDTDPTVSADEAKEERNSPPTMKIKDSGNIFEKLQGSINDVVDKTYDGNEISKYNPTVTLKKNEEPSSSILNSCISPTAVTGSSRSASPKAVMTSSRRSASPKELMTSSRRSASPKELMTSSRRSASPKELMTSSRRSASPMEVMTGSRRSASPKEVITATQFNKENTSSENPTKATAVQNITSKFPSNGSFYVCGFTDCRFACITSGEYREHLMCWHSDADEYKCAHCGHGSLTEDCHLRHMLTHSKASSFILYTCSYPACLYGTNVVDLFREHWNKFHPNTSKFKCRSCQMLFPTAEDLITHIQANILKFVACPHCTAKDSNRKTIIAHIIEAHPGKPRQITVASQLVCQERDHNEFAVPAPGIPEKPADVTPWPSVYMDDANDEDDGYADSVGQNNSCDDTEADEEEPVHLARLSEMAKAKGSLTKLAAEGDMRDAVKVMAINKSKLKSLSAEIIRCSECSYLASGRGLLRKHQLLHKRGQYERKRRFSCPCCPAAMDKLSKLSCHMNLHEGQHKVKVFFCTLCTFKTNVTEFLGHHMSKTHNSETNKGINYITKVLKVSVSAYFCDKCLFGTRDQELFKQHQLGHNDDNDDAATVRDQPFPSSSVPKPHTKKPQTVRSTFGENLNEKDLASVNPGSKKRFCCKLCGKYCSRLPALKGHMASHVVDKDLDILVYKCHYCAYSSTYKAFVSRHSEEKHPGKIIRVKRRVDIISASGVYLPPHGQEWPESPEDMEENEDIEINDMSICSHHCDICSYSCDDAAELLRHKNSQHSYQGPKKPFVVPSGNVFKPPVDCTECAFTTIRRIDLLRHIKTHPNLSPCYEAQPKEQRQLLKVAIGKKTSSSQSNESHSHSPSPDGESDCTPSPQMEDRKPLLAEDGSLIQEEVQKPKEKTPLYFLGGDLLHLKLRPCFIQEETNSEFTCKLCQDTFSGRYVLHKHILQHMDVSFYKCAYCSHGTLESPSMVVHIQKIHRKPIQHVQMDVTDLESKINKAIHSIKEEEYFTRMQDSDSCHANTDGRDCDSGDDFQPSETNYRSPFKAKVPPLTIKTSPSYDIVKKKSSSTAKKSTTSKPKPSFVSKHLQKSPVYNKSPVEDNPNIQKMGDIYKCKICSYTSTSRATVLNHLTIHSGFRRFGCPFCPYRSHWRHDCLKHIRTHHPGKHGQPTTDDPPDNIDPQLTLKPDKHSTSPVALKVPKVPKPSPQAKQPSATVSQPSAEDTANADTPEYRHVFKCLVCDTKFKSIWSIQKHFSKECSQPMLGCSTCKFKDLEPGAVKLHIETKHPGSETSRIVTLKREAKMRKYTIPTFKKQDSKESVGSTGGKSVKSDAADQDHDLPPKANLTPNNESQISKLKSPMSTSTSLSILIKRIGNRYMCRECGFSNPIKRALLRHVKKHSNARPFGCTYCEYRSNNECNTKRHMRRRHIGKPVIVRRLEPAQWHSPIPSVRKPAIASPTSTLDSPADSKDGEDNVSEGGSSLNSENSAKGKSRVEIRYFWKCLECGNKSNSVSNAYRHLKKGTCTKTLYGCSGCKLKNTDKKAVEFHLTEKHLNKNVQITICPNSAKIRKYHIPIKVGGYVQMSKEELSQLDDDTSTSTTSIPKSTTKTPPQDTEDVPKQNGEKSQVVFCSTCNLKASNAKIFQNHMESEHAGMLMVCKHCTIFRTAYVSKIQQHTWDSHLDMPLKFYLRTKKGVPDGEKRPSERYTCAKCDYIGKRSSVRQHLYCHFDYKPYKCGYCGYQTKKNDGVKRHIEKQHIGKPIKVLFKRNAAQEQEIEMLLDSHSPVKLSIQKSQAARLAKDFPFSSSPVKLSPASAAAPSQTFKKNYPTMANMKNSAIEDFIPSKMYKAFYNNKAGKSGFTCLLCPYNTLMQNTMISHVYHHMNSIYRCPYCSTHGYPRSKVTTHIRKQHPGRPVYVIDERQSKGLPTSTATSDSSEPAEKRRKIDQSSDNEFEVESNSGSITGSIKEETGIVQYSCHICSYSSQSLYHYRQHLAVHGGFKWLSAGTQLESRLKCGYCSYLAAGDKDFNAHMEKHLATRPFSCPYCDFSQYTQGKVKTHVAYAHPDKPVEVSRESGSSCLIDDTLQLDSVTLVQLDPRVKLVDFLTLGPADYEKLLIESNISVVDLDNIPDDRFSVVASNLGIALDDQYEVKEENKNNEYGDQYDDYVVKKEQLEEDKQTQEETTGEEMDISTMVTSTDTDNNDQNISSNAEATVDDNQDNVREELEQNYQQETSESNKVDHANDLSDVSDVPLSQGDESEEVETADESLIDMDFESVSQESADAKSLPDSNANENITLESALDTEEEATVQYASAMEEDDDESEVPARQSSEKTEEEMDTAEEGGDLDTSRASYSEPAWESQGFEVIDEV
ncbi:uncharacterized protein [Argopecten irradians]|uniref:uncharacterized protein n=1 Tax=Argopecten irradians TaxID=31199 RepID=UPI0037227592